MSFIQILEIEKLKYNSIEVAEWTFPFIDPYKHQ